MTETATPEPCPHPSFTMDDRIPGWPWVCNQCGEQFTGLDLIRLQRDTVRVKLPQREPFFATKQK
jgi:ribosomal protein L37AE/L43A